MNGIFTDKNTAIYNRNKLASKFNSTLNNQPLTVDYLYNPSHLAGLNDLIDVLEQGVFNQVSDYDLEEMLDDASQKVKTQKLLLVAHSQGNFYANNFYEKVADQAGGVPHKSIGVYGVGTPAGWVAGGGKYLTSDTDSVIAGSAAKYMKILPPNISIKLDPAADGNGHSFSGVYLKYQSPRIVSEIKLALNKLKTNEEQSLGEPCISPPEISTAHKLQGAVLSVADPAAVGIKGGLAVIYNGGALVRDRAAKVGGAIGTILRNTGLTLKNAVKGLTANVAESLPGSENPTTLATAGSSETQDARDASQENKDKAESVSRDIPSGQREQPEEGVYVSGETADKIEKEKHHSGGNGGGNGEGENTGAPPVVPEEGGEENPEEDEVIPPVGDTVPPVVIDPLPTPLPDPIPNPVPEPEPEPIPDPAPDYSRLSPSDLNANGIEDREEDEVIVSANKSLPGGEYLFKNLILADSAVLTILSDESVGNFQGVKIIADNIIVGSGSSISANAKGFMDGPGAPPLSNEFSGAVYGGSVNRSGAVPVYGSALEPTDLGSGGVGNNRGGGAIWLLLKETVTNDGIISANGDPNSSGGSIYVVTDNLAGNGKFAADGGGLYLGSNIYASGGGGRLAVYYKNSSWAGISQAKGGCGSYDGYSMVCAPDGTAGFFNIVNNDLHVYSSWLFQENDAPFDLHSISFTNGAKGGAEDGVSISAEELSIDEGSQFAFGEGDDIDIDSIKIAGASVVKLSNNLEIDAESVELAGNSRLTISPEQTLYLEVPSLTIGTGAVISADAKGYKDGPGASDNGSSYGGVGWGGLPVYGSESEPTDFGSGGINNYIGGGAIRIIADELINNGTVSANGEATSSGGSIYVTAKDLSGSGIFSANGGTVHFGSRVYGPGGGGRVAIYYELSSFTGQAQALGVNTNAGNSNPGTVLLVDTSIVVPDPDLVPEPEPDAVPDPIPDPVPDPAPAPGPDTIKPAIDTFTYNGNYADININPLINPVALIFNASENVNWLSIKIENEAAPNFYKIFQSSAECADGTAVCKKTWDGALSSGGLLADGVYKIKIHIKDAAGNEFYGYLDKKIIVDVP